VNLSGTLNFGDHSTIYGGYSKGYDYMDETNNIISIPGGNAFRGNTLNIIGSEFSVSSLKNFENYNFTLPAVLTPQTVMVTITGDPVELRNSNVAVTGKLPGGYVAKFNPGDRITLISHTTGNIRRDLMPTGVPIRQGVFIYEFYLNLDNMGDRSLYLDFKDTYAAPEAKSVLQGRTASLATLNRAMDLNAWDGMEEACRARGIFAVVGGNFSRYNTGSYVDMQGASVMTGYSWRPHFGRGKVVLTSFFEAGRGEYDTYNHFPDKTLPSGTIIPASNIRASGNVSYYGGGLLTRYCKRNGMYYEGSIKAGGTETSYYSRDLSVLTNCDARYNLNSPYFAMHGGFGREWQFSRRLSFDMYGKYFWTHQPGKTVDIAGDPINFDAMNSQRMRFGGRGYYTVNRNVKTYFGAAWEHEFSGTSRGNAYGYEFDSPSLKGHTGIGEVGVSFKPVLLGRAISEKMSAGLDYLPWHKLPNHRMPSAYVPWDKLPWNKQTWAHLPLYMDVGVQGYVGQREGIAANLQVRYER
jgi:hypothetical protein